MIRARSGRRRLLVIISFEEDNRRPGGRQRVVGESADGEGAQGLVHFYLTALRYNCARQMFSASLAGSTSKEEDGPVDVDQLVFPCRWGIRGGWSLQDSRDSNIFAGCGCVFAVLAEGTGVVRSLCCR